MTNLDDLNQKLDRIITELLPPIRAEKRVPTDAFNDLLELLDQFEKHLAKEEVVPKVLVGTLWFIFTSVLAEADHAKEPGPILNAAWTLQEKLRVIFGPRF